MNKKQEGLGRYREPEQQTQRQNLQKGEDNQSRYPEDNYSMGRKPDFERNEQRDHRNERMERQDKGDKPPQRKMFGFKQDQD